MEQFEILIIERAKFPSQLGNNYEKVLFRRPFSRQLSLD